MRVASLRRVLLARGLRAFADGFVSLLLPVYLLALGLTPFDVGIIATGTLLGSGALTLAIGYHAWRFHFRTLLLAAAALMTATGLSFAVVADFWPLLVVAIVGTLNPSSGDVSVFLPLEHALLAKLAPDRQRTAWFARYSLVGALLGAAGALLAAAPALIVRFTPISMYASLQTMFLLYALLGVASALVYRRLPAAPTRERRTPAAPLREGKRVVYTLAALFSLDALGGGFIVQSMLALWLFERFQLSTITAAAIFFLTGVFSALSYLVAVKIANRIGLVYTMVFTHLPSNVLLILVAFAPDLATSVALLLLRSALSQMDVPTRSSFVMAVVPPVERPAAASVTSVPRSLASASSPLLAGYLLGLSTFGWPLIIAGALKIAYDLLLLALFRRHASAR
ncbi:MAG: MFS transporter [Pseudomonadota bacterium]|nr:MFS transporter [Pseudomonadota bacterium]